MEGASRLFPLCQCHVTLCLPAILPVHLDIPVFMRWMIFFCSFGPLSRVSCQISGMCIHSFIHMPSCETRSFVVCNKFSNHIIWKCVRDCGGTLYESLFGQSNPIHVTPACRVVFTKQLMPMSYQQLWANFHGALFQSIISFCGESCLDDFHISIYLIYRSIYLEMGLNNSLYFQNYTGLGNMPECWDFAVAQFLSGRTACSGGRWILIGFAF